MASMMNVKMITVCITVLRDICCIITQVNTYITHIKHSTQNIFKNSITSHTVIGTTDLV